MYIFVAILILAIVLGAVHFSGHFDMKEKFDGFAGFLNGKLGYGEFKPMVVESAKIEVPEKKMTVPISIGDGLAVQAEVSVPAQQVEAPTQQSAMPPKEFEKSDVKVEEQTVTLPAQTGVIPAVVDEASGAVVGIPVSIPQQTVEIKAQDAHVQVMEGFRL
jgi:hypothetical protein